MYKRGNLDSTSLATLTRSLEVELDRLALQMSQPVDYMSLKTLYAQPARIFEGMIVKADGTTWNPGSGAGAYIYRGAAWHILG